MELTEDEVLQILRLLNESNFDQLHLEIGDLKLTVSKSGSIEQIQTEPAAPRTPSQSKEQTPNPVETKQRPAALAEKMGGATDTAAGSGLVNITAPLLGTFYSRPDPGSPPYVEAGKFVRPDDTVGLIEVMKLFTSVKAGLQGRINQICVESGQLVEYGQVLFLVKLDETSG